MRPSGREPDQLRDVSFQANFTRHAEGSVLAVFGHTQVLCTASVENRVPGWMRNSGRGWVTGEYGMLPRSTHTRSAREAARGKQSGRTQEIQRLIGRSLRAVTDLEALGERMVTLDCDVLQADGGTRTASISGAYVALVLAINDLCKQKKLKRNPIHGHVAAVSVGIYDGVPVLDLDYDEDSNIVPSLAEAMPTQSEDGKTFEFRIRQGVRFHDGTLLTADDIRFTMERMLHPDTNSPGYVFYGNIDGFDEFRDQGVGCLSFRARREVGDDAVAQDWQAQRFDIIDRNVAAPAQGGAGFSGNDQV